MRPHQPRHSDGHNTNVPQQQIVGFHVEGQSPSPSPNSILQESLRTISTGSPTPVIIPPQFQRDNSLPRSDSTASRSLAPEFTSSTAAGKPQNILRTTSGDRKPDLAASQGSTGAALPPPAPTVAAGQAGATQPQQQQQVEQQQQQQQAQPSAAGAAGANTQLSAAAGVGTAASSSGSSAATQAAGSQPTQQQTGKQQQQAQPVQPQQQPAESAPAAAGDGSSSAPPPGVKPPPKVPKPTSKAERRALQEAQRAAKAAAKGGAAGGSGSSGGGSSAGKGAAGADGAAGAAGRPPRAPGPAPAGRATAGGDSTAAGGTSSLSRGSSAALSASGAAPAGSSSTAGRAGRATAGGAASVLHSTELFAHLQQYRPVSVEAVLKGSSSVHPAVLALGLRYGDGSITGSTARCVALVHALCQVIADYHTPPGKSLQRDLMGTINAAVDFLVRCRPLSVSMGNAIKTLKLYISKTDPAAPETEAKASLLVLMREWLQEKVAMADKVLVEHAVTKVYDGDVILTYAYSQVVLEVLLSAAAAGRRFHVIVLDSRPELEGRQMLKRLLQADIPCSYVLLSGLSYIMREVSKVMLGASAVLSNGTVLSRAGSAAVAMTAHASSKPVLVCCEAFKFHERVQLDSITHNELGDPDMLAHLPPYAPTAAAGPIDPVKGAPSKDLKGWRDSPRLALLNLKYDAMPAEYVTMVVTEFGMIPPSSVPVILREFSQSAQLE